MCPSVLPIGRFAVCWAVIDRPIQRRHRYIERPAHAAAAFCICGSQRPPHTILTTPFTYTPQTHAPAPTHTHTLPKMKLLLASAAALLALLPGAAASPDRECPSFFATNGFVADAGYLSEAVRTCSCVCFVLVSVCACMCT